MLYFFIQGSYYLPSRKGEFPLLTIAQALFTYFQMYLYFFLFGVLLMAADYLCSQRGL